MTEPKERPIIFSGEMVRAILDGRKTQTRRVLKFIETGKKPDNPDKLNFVGYEKHCPYGQPGDRLWVKEEWAIHNCGSKVLLSKKVWPEWPLNRLKYLSTDKPPRIYEKTYEWWNKRTAKSMPRWASRITLEIVSVRVERLQDISEEDARAEGVKPFGGMGVDTSRHKMAFSQLWNKINGPCAWERNKVFWVWVIEFRRIKP